MQEELIMNLGSYYLTVGTSRSGRRCWLTRAAICSGRTLKVLYGFTCESKSFHEAVGIAYFEAKRMLEYSLGADAVTVVPGEIPFLVTSSQRLEQEER